VIAAEIKDISVELLGGEIESPIFSVRFPTPEIHDISDWPSL
jgi:hypothetical protein